MVYQNNKNRNNFQNNKRNEVIYEKINEPLSTYYSDKAKLFLENGKAHEYAKQFKPIASHQLRKILNQSKQAMAELERKDYNLQNVINKLYAILPLAAYNAGRDKNLKDLYAFLSAHVNEKTIKSEKDIRVFDELFTSIIAYHKFEGGK